MSTDDKYKSVWPRDKSTVSRQDEIDSVFIEKPHVFILGAGASVAATPEGDKNGKKLPVMDNLVEIVGLNDLLSGNNIEADTNFEVTYSRLVSDKSKAGLVKKIEERVSNYFGSLELPSHPTIYDYLVLSLRKKDIIATFNWDPFLPQAIERNKHITEMPGVFFLHGCAIAGYCKDHLRKGRFPNNCPQCNTLFERSKLLFPVETKNYNNDPQIKSEWENIREVLNRAFLLTIFGYGAPASDVEAVSILQRAWQENKGFEFQETEIIDIKNREALEETWENFWFSDHFGIEDNFFNSFVASHPRRTCEAIYSSTMEEKWREGNPVPQDTTFDNLYRWFEPLLKAENR